MRWFKWSCLVLASLAIGLLLYGQADVTRESDVAREAAANRKQRAEQGLFHPPTPLAAADGLIDHGDSWGHCGPWVEDVDGDKVKDLVVGDFSGLFHFYRNKGTSQKPQYAKAVNLQAGGEDAKVPIY